MEKGKLKELLGFEEITSETNPCVEKPIKLQIPARCVGQIRSTEDDKSEALRASLTSAGGGFSLPSRNLR